MWYFTGFPMHFISFRLILFHSMEIEIKCQQPTNNYSCVYCISTNCEPEIIKLKYEISSILPLPRPPLRSLICCAFVVSDNLIAKPQNCGCTANAQSKVHCIGVQCMLLPITLLPPLPPPTICTPYKTKKKCPLEHLLHKVHAIFMLCKLIKYQMGSQSVCLCVCVSVCAQKSVPSTFIKLFAEFN